ncbi:MAG: phosphoadenosine phosphosulfate reductase family protein [Desulfurococcaceae archaeon]
MRKLWPKTVKIYWDPWRNIPVVKPNQEELDLFYQLRLSEPGDARPAFPGDLEKIKEAIAHEFGSTKLFDHLVKDRIVLLNKVPHWDLMYEVVVSGNVIGQLYYDPYKCKWRFRLTYQGAYTAVQNNLVDTIRGDPPYYSGKVVREEYSSSARELVLIDHKGTIRGVCEVLPKGEVVISKTFHDKTAPVETSDKPASVQDLVKYNEEGILTLEEKSIKYLRRLFSRYSNLRPVVSYSGGKDSLVALDLAHRAFGDLDILFNDTGLEMPETLRNVEYVANYYGYKLYVASAGDIFWRAVDVFGPPGKDYRWCCKVTKLVPIAKLTKAVWPNGGFNIVGQRAYESLDRASSPLVWRNKWIRHMVSTTPIQYWSQLSTWIYIFKYNLPFNKLYTYGFDRLGCFMCPSCALAEFEETKKLYPDLWGRWEHVLRTWKNRMTMPEEWIKLGLWRWLTPATAKKRLMHHVPAYSMDWRKEYIQRLEKSKSSLIPLAVVKEGDKITIQFSKNLLPEDQVGVFIANMGSLGFIVVSKEPLVFEKANARYMIKHNTINVSNYKDELFEDLVDVLKVIYRMHNCVYCGSCVLWTRKGSVALTPKGPIVKNDMSESEKRVYMEICPISDQLVEKVVLSLLLNDYRAFKRKTRRRI